MSDPLTILCAIAAVGLFISFFYWLNKREPKKALASLIALVFSMWAAAMPVKADTFPNTAEGWKQAAEQLREKLEKK